MQHIIILYIPFQYITSFTKSWMRRLCIPLLDFRDLKYKLYCVNTISLQGFQNLSPSRCHLQSTHPSCVVEDCEVKSVYDVALFMSTDIGERMAPNILSDQSSFVPGRDWVRSQGKSVGLVGLFGVINGCILFHLQISELYVQCIDIWLLYRLAY